MGSKNDGFVFLNPFVDSSSVAISLLNATTRLRISPLDWPAVFEAASNHHFIALHEAGHVEFKQLFPDHKKQISSAILSVDESGHPVPPPVSPADDPCRTPSYSYP